VNATAKNPSLQIALGGEALDPEFARRAATVLVRQRLSAPSLAEISFAEPTAQHLSALRFGASLRLGMGNTAVIFDGEITAIEYLRDGAEGRVVRVRAYDPLHRLRKKQRARTVVKVSVSQFIGDTVREIGLECHASVTDPARSVIAQHDQSDLDMVGSLAAESGLYFYLEDGMVRLVSLAGEGEPIELKVGVDLSKAQAASNAESMRRGTQTKAWDVLRTTVLGSSASVARQDANDTRSMDLSAFADLGARVLFNRLAGAADQAQGMAQADLDRAAARELIVEATADGNARIRPGQTVRIVNLDDAVDGIFTVTEATHTFSDDSGYLTEFSTAPPQVAGNPRSPVFTFGSVIDLSDPEGLSRVRARLPLLGDIESDWMPVLVAGAGADKGLAVIPEVGDDVLIVFPQGDVAYGIVLGGLFGARKSPGLGDKGTRPFAFRTGKGQAITLDAANGLVRMETGAGDVIELGPKGTSVHATQDLRIEAPGRTLTIRAKAVNFEQA
jgi:phage protein D/phage baseplate assembly protein gpV